MSITEIRGEFVRPRAGYVALGPVVQLDLASVLVEPERFVAVLVVGHDGLLSGRVGSRCGVVFSVIDGVLASVLFYWQLEGRYFCVWDRRHGIITSG